jgi:hypothetical protein
MSIMLEPINVELYQALEDELTIQSVAQALTDQIFGIDLPSGAPMPPEPETK